MIWETIQEKLQVATDPKYRIHRLLGHGGMAGVYLAEQPSLGRFVAIKVISPLFMADPEFVARFLHEARTVAKLHHPHIVTIHEIEQTADLQYFTMSFVPGNTLGKVMEGEGDSLSIEIIKVWLAQVGGALDYGHRKGVIHRDIKPTNIILDGEGNAKVTDFGIAKVADQPGMTKTGVLMGTPSYMSPEQCSGGTISGQSDQYSLGTVAYQLVTGHPPFEGPTMSVLDAHLRKDPAPVRTRRPDCPADLAEAIERMLRKDPADRWTSIAEALAGMAILNPDVDIDLRREMAHLSGFTGRVVLDSQPSVEPPETPLVPDGPNFLEGPETPKAAGLPPIPQRSATVVAGVAPIEPVETAPPMEPRTPIEPAPVPPVSVSAGKGTPPKKRTLLPWVGGGIVITAAAVVAALVFGVGSPDGPEGAEGGGQGTRPVSLESESPSPQELPPPTELEDGRILVEGELPEGFLVLVRGEGQPEITVADREISLTPGTYDLQLSAPGFEAAAATLTVRPGESESWSPELVADTPSPSAPDPPPLAQGRVNLLGDLPTSFVVVVRGDGAERRFSASSFSVAPGTYRLELQADGYVAQSTRLEVGPGEDQSWRPELVNDSPSPPPAEPPASAEGRVSILGEMPGDATLRIRGDEIDEEISGSVAFVPAGSYDLQFTAPGYISQTIRLEVRSGEESRWTPDLVREPPADLDARIRGELVTLAGLLEGRDLAPVRDGFPNVRTEVERVLGPLVENRENVRNFEVSVGTVTRIEVTADHAVVEFPLLLSWRDPRNASEQAEIRFQARFNESQGRWILAELQQQR